MKNCTAILLITFLFAKEKCQAQLTIDLGSRVSSTKAIPLGLDKAIVLKNMSPRADYSYSYKISVVEHTIPPFSSNQVAGDVCVEDANNENLLKVISDLANEKEESSVKSKIDELKKEIKNLGNKITDGCNAKATDLINRTEFKDDLLIDFKANQIITVTVTRKVKGQSNDSDVVWTQGFTTPEKTPWLVHYGLTYTPSVISKYDTYYARDSSVAQTYTITKRNNNGPKPWENISATINFTYPFSQKERGIDAGFTAGFGLNAGLQLSGQAGLSAIIGKNVILGTGVVFMQKNKLNGQFKEGQIIKDNLAFDALHERVWRPEFFITIGFRFDKNPFSKTSSDDSTDSKKSDDSTGTTKKTTQ